MRPSLLIGTLVCGLATLGVLAWTRVETLESRQQDLDRLAWGLKHKGAAGRLSAAELAFLEGRFLDAASAPASPPEYLVENALRCQLYSVSWPRQVVRHELIHSAITKGRWYAVRVVESGYLGSKELPLVEQFSFDEGKWKSLSSRRWRAVQELKAVHLERREPGHVQAYLAGTDSSGKSQVEVVRVDEGFKSWRQTGQGQPVLADDHIRFDQKRYKLVDGEWSALSTK